MNGKRATALFLGAMLLMPTVAFGGWQEGNPLIAHALGAADGKIELNSREAFEQSWGNGFGVVEADFSYTSDGALVLRHDFEEADSYYRLEQKVNGDKVMDSKTYGSSKIVYEQTPLTAVDLMSMMAQYPEMIVVTDTKETDEATVKKQFTDLKNIATNMEMPALLDRFVPQIYNESMYTWIKEIYPFQEWIYTLYLDSKPDYPKIATFCKERGIGTVTIHKERVTKDIVDIMHKENIKVYAHTVNRYLQFEGLLAMGVDGVYTDTIKPYELDWVGLTPNRKAVEKTFMADGKEAKLTSLSLLGEDYVPLREMATLGKGFSAKYDREKAVLALTPGERFTTLGNELSLEGRGNFVAKKAKFTVTYHGKNVEIAPIFVDGEVYVSFEKMKTVMGIASL